MGLGGIHRTAGGNQGRQGNWGWEQEKERMSISVASFMITFTQHLGGHCTSTEREHLNTYIKCRRKARAYRDRRRHALGGCGVDGWMSCGSVGKYG